VVVASGKNTIDELSLAGAEDVLPDLEDGDRLMRSPTLGLGGAWLSKTG
jgi:hypothetical protein